MAMFGKGVTDSAGILEVLGKSGSADSTASVFTLIPTDETVPPEPRAAQNVDGALAAVDEYLKARNADAVFRPLVLIPAGCGEGWPWARTRSCCSPTATPPGASCRATRAPR